MVVLKGYRKDDDIKVENHITGSAREIIKEASLAYATLVRDLVISLDAVDETKDLRSEVAHDIFTVTIATYLELLEKEKSKEEAVAPALFTLQG